MFKGLAVVAALAVISAGSQAAAATQIFLRSSTMDRTHTARITGNPAGALPNLNINAYATGVTFSANYGSTRIVDNPLDATDVFDIYGFCVDIFHPMYLQNPLNYTYQESVLVDDRSGVSAPFDATTLGRIATLVTLGSELHATGNLADATVKARLSGIQTAIWQIGNPLYTVAPNASVVPYFNDYLNMAVDPTARMYTIVDTTGVHQSFAIAAPRVVITAVPEPATWAMMLVGFFGLGAALRSGRGGVAATA